MIFAYEYVLWYQADMPLRIGYSLLLLAWQAGFFLHDNFDANLEDVCMVELKRNMSTKA